MDADGYWDMPAAAAAGDYMGYMVTVQGTVRGGDQRFAQRPGVALHGVKVLVADDVHGSGSLCGPHAAVHIGKAHAVSVDLGAAEELLAAE